MLAAPPSVGKWKARTMISFRVLALGGAVAGYLNFRTSPDAAAHLRSGRLRDLPRGSQHAAGGTQGTRGLSCGACCATSGCCHTRQRSRGSAGAPCAGWLHACAGRLSVHGHRPGDHSGAIKVAETLIAEPLLITLRLGALAALFVAGISITGCSIPAREPPVPRTDTTRALPLGIPNARFFADASSQAMLELC